MERWFIISHFPTREYYLLISSLDTAVNKFTGYRNVQWQRIVWFTENSSVICLKNKFWIGYSIKACHSGRLKIIEIPELKLGALQFLGDDLILSTSTHCVLSDMYLSNHIHGMPLIPKLRNLSIKILWSSMSNPLYRSKKLVKGNFFIDVNQYSVNWFCDGKLWRMFCKSILIFMKSLFLVTYSNNWL